jgi:DNA-binding PadR family transcriptional regulator
MSLKHGLLGLLNYGDMTGYELDKAFKVSLNFFWQAQTSQIYRELNAMEKQAWLTSLIIPQTGKTNRKLYKITDLGRIELKTWLSKKDLEEDLNVKNVFLMKMFFSAEVDVSENIKTLKSYKAQCLGDLQAMAQTGSVISDYGQNLDDKNNMVYWASTASFGVYYLNMCVKWAEDTIKKLEEIS